MHASWKEVGPVSLEEKEILWNSFQEGSNILHEKRRLKQEAATANNKERLSLKEKIVEELENLAADQCSDHKQWQNSTDKAKELRESMSKIGRTFSTASDLLWDRFKKSEKLFFKNRNQFYKGKKAALKVDDIIIKVDDEKITTSRELANAIGLKGSGDTVIIEYMRGSDILKTEATLGQQVSSKQSGSDIHPGLNGASLASSMDKPGIIVTEIEAGSPAAQRGLRKGDIIIAVNRLKVETIQQLEKIAKQNSILYLMFERDNRTLILRIQ